MSGILKAQALIKINNKKEIIISYLPSRLNTNGFAHIFVPLLAVFVVAVSGSYLLVKSHADSLNNQITGVGGYCLDLDGAADNKAKLEMNACSSKAAGQQWTVSNDGTIRTNGYCMEDKGGSTVPQTRARITDCDGTATQKWTVSSGTIKSVSAPKLCLEVKDGKAKDGTNVWLNTCDGGAAQSWKLNAGGTTTPTPTPTPTPPTPTPTPPTTGTVVSVSSSAQLTAALANATAGQTIKLADGTYSGHFNSTKSGTSANPITLSGGRGAIINGGSLTSGYTLSLGTKNSASTVSYWRLDGFTVTGGQKGIVLDNVQKSTINNVYVHDIGEEGIHLRDFSSDNVVSNNTVTLTGRDQQAYGEGIYIGTANSNIKTFSQSKNDNSNNNQITGNTISQTGAENIDIKEGTHNGTITGNHFDGTGMCYNTSADCNYADSWIDMKGNGWTVSNNTGVHMHVTWKSGTSGNKPPTNDGIQDHVISSEKSEGSGSNNTFSSNTISDVGGFGLNIDSGATGVKVACTNTATSAGSGLSNLACKN